MYILAFRKYLSLKYSQSFVKILYMYYTDIIFVHLVNLGASCSSPNIKWDNIDETLPLNIRSDKKKLRCARGFFVPPQIG
jgi:hypothetical protein